MRDDKADFEELETEIFGVNFASRESHQKYAAKLELNFPLLSDPKLEMCEKYETRRMNRIERTVVIADKEGVVRYYQRGLPSDQELHQAILGFPAAQKKKAGSKTRRLKEEKTVVRKEPIG